MNEKWKHFRLQTETDHDIKKITMRVNCTDFNYLLDNI